MKNISDRLNEALNIRGMKPIELSEKTGIDKGSISSYLSGRYLPKSKNIYKIATILNVDPTWLLGYDVPMEKEIFTLYGNDTIRLWDDMFGYNKNDEILLKNFCYNVVFIYQALNSVLTIFNSLSSELKDTINNSKKSQSEKKELFKIINVIDDIFTKLNEESQLQLKYRNLNIEQLQLLKEYHDLLKKRLDENKITLEEYTNRMNEYNKKFSKYNNNINQFGIKIHINNNFNRDK